MRVGLIGAGGVNFGGAEGPWDHASRLERLEGLEVVGVADPDEARARAALAGRDHPCFRAAKVFGDFRDLLAVTHPDAVWIGVPPCVHGTAGQGMDIELQCARLGVHMFVEKPLSSARPEDVQPVAEALARAPVIVSVGYMFRYSRAVEAMRRALDETGSAPRAFLARYDCAYSDIRKESWWDVRSSGGAVVEQATHMVDLARYLLGDVEESSIRGAGVPAASPLGERGDMPRRPDGEPYGRLAPPECRMPQLTSALWRFRSGAVGSLTHGVLLHGRRYDAELEIWGDGLRMILEDPYGRPTLRVRRPGTEAYEVETFGQDDPYLAEDRAFVEAVRRGDDRGIRSSYADAFRTFRLCWAIQDAAGEAC
jgi:predicted dehydrogenase